MDCACPDDPFHPRTPPAPTAVPIWLDNVFLAKSLQRGGIVRRAARDVEREVGRAAFLAEVRRRRFHLVECGGQFIVICNPGHLQVLC